MMKICVVFILGLMIGYIAGGGTEVYWRVLERIEKYGDNLTLICKLNETLQTLQTSMRWYKGETLCSFDDQTSYNTKYKAVIVPKGVKLTILSFVLEDINEIYYCAIGFDKSEKQILSEEMVFREKKAPVKSNQSLNDGDNTVIIVPSLFGSLVLGLLSLVFLWKRGFFRRCMEKQAHTHRVNGNGPTQDQSHVENGEVKVPLRNGRSNGKRNSSLNESEDVVQNGEVKVPLLNGQSNGKRNSSLNESEDVVQNEDLNWFSKALEVTTMKYICSARDDPKSEMAAISEETHSQTGRDTPQTTTSPPVSDEDSEEELADNELTVVDEVSTTRENDDETTTSSEKLVTPLDTPVPVREPTPPIQALPTSHRKSDTPETLGATTN